MIIRELQPTDIVWAEPIITDHFGSMRLVSRMVIHDASTLPGLVVEEDSQPMGLLQYRIDHDQCEVVVLISIAKRVGVGRMMLEAVRSIAREAGCKRLWLVTTNNNKEAIEFYRTVGWSEVAVHRGAVRESRKLKPEIPEFDERGVPIEDEIEFELSIEESQSH